MKKTFFLLIALSCLLSFSCKPQEPQESQIVWDSWGVPHIYANNIGDLFYQQGWAQMHSHANLVLELYGTSRGKGAEYWGQSKLQNDMLIHTLGFDALADEWGQQQDEEATTMINAFVAGLNAYAEAHPDAIKEENKVVLPITAKDVSMHSMYVIFT